MHDLGWFDAVFGQNTNWILFFYLDTTVKAECETYQNSNGKHVFALLCYAQEI
jgi:hypothetical protein